MAMAQTSPNQPLQATAAAPFGFGTVGDSLLPGFFVARPPAAVPELSRSAWSRIYE